jgi:hypothetical protein
MNTDEHRSIGNDDDDGLDPSAGSSRRSSSICVDLCSSVVHSPRSQPMTTPRLYNAPGRRPSSRSRRGWFKPREQRPKDRRFPDPGRGLSRRYADHTERIHASRLRNSQNCSYQSALIREDPRQETHSRATTLGRGLSRRYADHTARIHASRLRNSQDCSYQSALIREDPRQETHSRATTV